MSAQHRNPAPLLPLVLALVAVALPAMVTNRYLFHLLIMTAIWGILAVSLNLVLGYTGLLSVAHGAFFGIGAYTSSLLVLKAHWNFWLTVPPAILLAAMIGALLGVLTLRLKGHYFAISTLSFGIVVSLVLEKWETLTAGPRGLNSIPAPTPIHLPGLVISFQSNAAKYYLALLTLMLCLLLVDRLVRSPVGRALEAIRQNELVASCLAVDPVYYKLLAFSISAAMAGAAGVLYAVYITYIGPNDAGFWNGFYAILYVVIGGMGTLWGPLIGAFVLVTIPEFLRVFENFRLLTLGAVLIVTITFLPYGIAGGVRRLWQRGRSPALRRTP